MTANHPSAVAPRVSFWRRRVVGPLTAQLTQGVTPGQIALTVALGLVCGLFPFLGFTTGLCFLAALAFRLNQPIIHLVNQLLWPAQLALIPVYVKLGALLYGATVAPFRVDEATRLFWAAPREFWHRFGLIGVYAFSAWALTAPLIAGLAYGASLPALQRLAAARPRQTPPLP